MVINATSRDISISAIRFVATIFIVTCHFMQYLNCELAWWFNVGVQMFLCISGYLYGTKDITDMPAFYKKTFQKILVGYFCVAIPFLCVHLILIKDIGIKDAVLCLLGNQTMPGGGHLWFIPLILLCYLITPFLNQYFKPSSILFVRLFMILLATLVTFKLFITYFNPAWVSCYIIGFFLSRLSDQKTERTVSIILVAFAVIFNSAKIIFQYIMQVSFPLFGVFCDYSHLLLGVGLFIVLRSVFSKIKKPNNLLLLSDKYSFQVYLSHQFFISGPLTLMALTPYIPINIVITMFVIFLTAFCVKQISKLLDKLIDYVFIKLRKNMNI